MALAAMVAACGAQGQPETTPGSATPPSVTKVEPPNWWPGHSVSSVQVLVSGEHLVDVAPLPKADALRDGVAVVAARSAGEGAYAFLEVRIDRDARPGPRRLPISIQHRKVEIPFQLSEPLPAEDRFQGFSSDDVIYLAMPDRFANGDPQNDEPATSPGLTARQKARYYHGGDFQGLIDRLPYLKRLGITALWLNPVFDNANRKNDREVYDGEAITDYHGYGSVDFYGVEEHFGDMAKLRELTDAAHRLHIKVILDQVENHTGPFHPWAERPPTPTWFHGTVARHTKCNLEFAAVTDPAASDEARKAVLDGWFIDILPDLDQSDPDVSRYLVQNSLWWVGMTGIDGIRQDTLPYAPRSFWRTWMAGLKRQYPHFTVVGEANHPKVEQVSFFQGGKARYDGVDSGVDALFDFPLVVALRRAFATGKSLREVAAAFEKDAAYVDPQQLVTFVGLHDMKRFMNEPGATVAGLALAQTLVMTARGVPMLYYGDEIAMPGEDDPDNRRDFPGEWSDDERAAVKRDPASDPPGLRPDQRALLSKVARLGRVRSELEVLRRGKMVPLAVTDATLVFARVTADDAAVVAINASGRPVRVTFKTDALPWKPGARVEDWLAAAPRAMAAKALMSLDLPVKSAVILAPKRPPAPAPVAD